MTLSLKSIRIVLLLLCSFGMACSSDPEKQEKPDPLQFKPQLEKVNKYQVEKESDEIQQFILRQGWNMQTTGTGLRYVFIKRTEGEMPTSGQRVRVNYKIALLDGTICYSSDEKGPYEFVVEGDALESGLHEGIQLMKVGERAKFILPSYLAHGLHGDDAVIPPLSALVVDIELLAIVR